MGNYGGMIWTREREKLLISLPELCGSPTSSLVASRRNRAKEMNEFGLAKYFCSFLPNDLLHAL
jgi:hypothetical protein